MKKLYMVCNAHVDPIWQWQWDEGIGIALSTFRTAADFCEENDHFVFNHNESLLYQWVLEYDPDLFARIQRLVKAGKWRIMGGWYLQPDCNMPAGESIIRQIRVGNAFFFKHFGVKPETAVNFDTFGHSRGLVQILRAAGYHTYMFMRPDKGSGMLEELPQYFLWKGFGGAEIPAFRLESQYATATGKVVGDTADYIAAHQEAEISMKTWGIGDHGGGPSRRELAALEGFMAEKKEEMEIFHSDPDSFFREAGAPTKTWEKGINPMFIGVYTSMADVKKGHRMLENALYSTEKLVSAVACQGIMDYPYESFREAEKALLFTEFHDTIAGTISRTSEKEAIITIGYALELLARARTRAFYAIASRQAPALPDSLPIFVYNPHPYPVRDILECEITLADYNWEDCMYQPRLLYKGRQVRCQNERESGNVPIEYRKRFSFEGELAPMAMERFDLFFDRVPIERRVAKPITEPYHFENGLMEVDLDPATGWISRYHVGGRSMSAEGFGRLTVNRDNADPWGMLIKRIGVEKEGEFTLMSGEDAATFAGVDREAMPPVNIVEDGPVRTVIEALFRYRHSSACVRYILPKNAAYLDIELTIYWQEKDKLLRLEIPSTFENPVYSGQTMFGVDRLDDTGEEMVCQKWAAAADGERCLTVINDGTYGLCCADGAIKLSLLRAPAYAAMPVLDRPIIPSDRFTDRIDQGEKRFSFRIQGGETAERMEHVDIEAQVFAEKPHVLNIFPTVQNEKAYQPPLTIEGGRLDAFYPCEDGNGYVLRLFNCHDRKQKIRICSEHFHVEQAVEFTAYEMRTYRISDWSLTESDLFA